MVEAGLPPLDHKAMQPLKRILEEYTLSSLREQPSAAMSYLNLNSNIMAGLLQRLDDGLKLTCDPDLGAFLQSSS